MVGFICSSHLRAQLGPACLSLCYDLLRLDSISEKHGAVPPALINLLPFLLLFVFAPVASTAGGSGADGQDCRRVWC